MGPGTLPLRTRATCPTLPMLPLQAPNVQSSNHSTLITRSRSSAPTALELHRARERAVLRGAESGITRSSPPRFFAKYVLKHYCFINIGFSTETNQLEKPRGGVNQYDWHPEDREVLKVSLLIFLRLSSPVKRSCFIREICPNFLLL